MEEWKEYKLGDVSTFSQGIQVDINKQYSDYKHGRVRFIRIVDFTKKDEPIRYIDKPRDKCLTSDGDIVMIRYGSQTAGLVAKSYDGAIANNIFKITFNNAVVTNEFGYYYLSQKSIFDYLRGAQSSSTMPAITFEMAGRVSLFVPPINIQKIITRILHSLDDKIEVNRRINDNLEQQAQALFKSWFVDFEPFKGGEFEESELGMIPKSWRVVSLGDLMSYNGGSQPPASEFVEDYKDGYVRFIQIRDYASDGHITYIPISKRNKLCDIRDIMIARYGASLGRICYGLRGAYNVALAKVTPIEPYYLEFLRCYLNTREFYEGINNKGNRAVQAGFNQSDIQSFRIAFPNNEDIIQKFENVCSAYFDNRLLLEQESRRLAELRDTLLPRLMSGKIKVGDVTL